MDFSEYHAQAPPCWDFMRGKCGHTNCKFTHPAGIFFSPHNRHSPFPPPRPLPPDVALAEEAFKDAALSHTLSQPPVNKNGITPPAIFYKPIAWKTAPCRHFIRTGFCPMGDECNFIHDLSLLEAARVGKTSGQAKQTNQQNNPSMSHCWAYIQGKCRNQSCKYLHPGSIEPYKKYTPCVAWPLCPYGENCEFKHPEPLGTQQPSIPPDSPPCPDLSPLPSEKPQISPLSLPQPIYTAAPSLSPTQPVYLSGPVSYPPLVHVSPNPQMYSPVEINGTTYYNPGPFSPTFTSPTAPFPPTTSLSPMSPVTSYYNPISSPFNHATPYDHSGIIGQLPHHPYPPPLSRPAAASASVHPSETAESWRNPRPFQRSSEFEPQNVLGLHHTFSHAQTLESLPTSLDVSPVSRSSSWRNKSGSKANASASHSETSNNQSQTHHDEVYRADPRRRVGHARRISVQVKNHEENK